ncbi:MAG: DUF4129 domain-containing protein [Caldilineae bacterium]|nr:DUF4129 domain-containing protein [Caldilineae bacterium]
MKPRTGWSSILLVALMMLTVAWSIGVAQPAPGVEILTPVVLGGVLVGAILGLQPWMPVGLAHAWSMLLGLASTLFFAAGTLARFPSAPVEAIAGLGRLERMALVRDWYLAWIGLQRYGASFDPQLAIGPAEQSDLAYLFFAVTMALLMWLLAYICTWFIVRYLSWWGAVLPSGFALVFNLTNTRMQDVFLVYLGFFLLCALLLASQSFLATQTLRWREQHVGYGMDLGFDLLRDGLVLTLAVLALAWTLPTDIDPNALQQATRQLTREPQSRIARQMRQWFPNLSYPTRGGGNAFGSEMGLSGAIELGDEPIFDVLLEAGAEPPRYWRQAVFDRYDGSGWQRNGDEARAVTAGGQVGAAYPATRELTQTFTTYHTRTTQLYAAPQPERFDLPLKAELAGGGQDLLTVDSLAPLSPGARYSAVSRITQVDQASLRASGDQDPDWVRERYLQLPDSVTERTRALSGDLTTGATNRYDRALAIEAYLRSTYPYNEQIATPPDDQDRVDWFLFDERQGYCDYYSSSFVVLARLAGIPARIAAGYSLGSRVDEAGTWRHRASDAHTWPEVYFPMYGWVEFEPTAADPLLARPTGPEALDPLAEGPAPGGLADDMLPDEDRGGEPIPTVLPTDGGPADAGSSQVGDRTRLPLIPLLVGLSALLLAAGIGWLALERPLRGLSPAEGAFARLARVAGWLGLGPRPADTPDEYGQRVAAALPEGAEDIRAIVDGYTLERFGRRTSTASSERLDQAWARLRQRISRAAGRLGWERIRRR